MVTCHLNYACSILQPNPMNRKHNLLISVCLSAVMLLFCSVGINKNSKKEPLVFTATLGAWKHSNDGYYAVATTVLTNNTHDTFELATMSCDLESGCSTDSKTIKLGSHDCLRNVPEFIKIWPHNNYIREIGLWRDDSTKNVDSIFHMSVDIHPATYNNISDRKRRRLISEFIPQSCLRATKDTTYNRPLKSYIFDMDIFDYQPLDREVESIILWSNPIKSY